VLLAACSVDLPATVLELHELEVSPPRADFDHEVRAAEHRVLDHAIHSNPACARLCREFADASGPLSCRNQDLLARVAAGDSIPRLNSLTDVFTILSLESQIPIGLYDLDKLVGGLEIRVAQPDEWFAGQDQNPIRLLGGLCVADAVGPCGNLADDALRTAVTADSERAACVFFLPCAPSLLSRSAEWVARYGRGLTRVVPSNP